MDDSSGSGLVVGDAAVDLYQVEGDPATTGSCFEWYVGGTATNVARWLATPDADVALVTNVGTDTAGEMAVRHLDASSVQTDHVTGVDGPSTVTLHVPTANDGHWDAWIRGTCCGFTPPEDPGSLVAADDWLHLEGVTLPEAVKGPAVRELARAADTNGTAVTFDPNGRPKQWDRPAAYRDALEDILPHCSAESRTGGVQIRFVT